MKLSIDHIGVDDLPSISLGLQCTEKAQLCKGIQPANSVEYTITEVANIHFRQYLETLINASKRIVEVD
jgi:hypothetical protein